jgi:hypothetical protein
LFDGVPTSDDIERLSWNVPKQEAGRVTNREISVSRANRSVRLFKHVVDSLAEGRQPDPEQIEAVGYLMRTTAVYGSGKLGAADREAIADRPEFAAPFQPEMLSVFLTRAYTLDLVEHMARARAPETAVGIDRDLRRRFGVGNSTGLGRPRPAARRGRGGRCVPHHAGPCPAQRRRVALRTFDPDPEANHAEG